MAAYTPGRIKLPKDVTIIWSDDNCGYVLRLDSEKERKIRTVSAFTIMSPSGSRRATTCFGLYRSGIDGGKR
jgi:hypothetical protein